MMAFLRRIFGEDAVERSIHDEELDFARANVRERNLLDQPRLSPWVRRAQENDLPTHDTTNGADAYRTTRSKPW